jgi:hypothetical protein
MEYELKNTSPLTIDLNALANEVPEQSTDLSTNGINEAHHNDTRLQLNSTIHEEINERFGPNTNAIITAQSPPTNPVEIMIGLIGATIKQKRNRMLRTFLVAIILIGSSIGFFVWDNSNMIHDNREAAPLLLAIFLLLGGVGFFIASWAYCCAYACCPSDDYDQLNKNIERVILIDGETWQHQVDAIQASHLPGNIVGFFGRGEIYRRLKKRTYGHIVLAKEGIILDELILILYEKLIVLGVERLTNSETQAGFILRVHLLTRYFLVGGLSKGAPTMFHVDLFMPPQMESQDVDYIARGIPVNSRICLFAPRFAF